MKQAIKEKLETIIAQGLVCLDVFERTGQRCQFTAFEDQLAAFADECLDDDVKNMLDMVR